MIKIAIVEDEEQYIELLSGYLKDYERDHQEEIVTTIYHDGDEIINKYKAQFDLILMDIQMGFMDGMSAAEEIRKVDSEVVIIFITNMTQYAIRGYEVDALDYMIKPVSYFAFSAKITKAINKIRNRKTRNITVNVKGGVMRLNTSDIRYVESQGHTLFIHTSGGIVLSSDTMKAVEEALAGTEFSKGNKCYLINLAYVDGIQDKCAVIGSEKLKLSRPRYNAFMQDLTRYWGEPK